MQFFIFFQHFIDILADNGWIEGALNKKDLFIYWNWDNLLSVTLFHKNILEILLVLNTLNTLISPNFWNSLSKSILPHGKFVEFLLEMNFEWIVKNFSRSYENHLWTSRGREKRTDIAEIKIFMLKRLWFLRYNWFLCNCSHQVMSFQIEKTWTNPEKKNTKNPDTKEQSFMNDAVGKCAAPN